MTDAKNSTSRASPSRDDVLTTGSIAIDKFRHSNVSLRRSPPLRLFCYLKILSRFLRHRSSPCRSLWQRLGFRQVQQISAVPQTLDLGSAQRSPAPLDIGVRALDPGHLVQIGYCHYFEAGQHVEQLVDNLLCFGSGRNHELVEVVSCSRLPREHTR